MEFFDGPGRELDIPTVLIHWDVGGLRGYGEVLGDLVVAVTDWVALGFRKVHVDLEFVEALFGEDPGALDFVVDEGADGGDVDHDILPSPHFSHL